MSHAMCGATQDERVMVEKSDKTWSTGEGNGNPLQCSCLENLRDGKPGGSRLFTCQTMVEVMKIMATCFKRSRAPTAAQRAPNPAAGHRRPTRPPGTPGHVQVSVSFLWGHCSLLLSPGAHKVLFVPSKSLFPQSCVSSGSSMVGLMVTSSKRAYAIPKSAASCHAQFCVPEPLPPWQSTADSCLHRRHSNTVLSQSLWGLWVLVPTRYV